MQEAKKFFLGHFYVFMAPDSFFVPKQSVRFYVIWAPDRYFTIYTYSGKCCVLNFSYTMKGFMTKLPQIIDLYSVKLFKKQSFSFLGQFYVIMAPECFIHYIHKLSRGFSCFRFFNRVIGPFLYFCNNSQLGRGSIVFDGQVSFK